MNTVTRNTNRINAHENPTRRTEIGWKISERHATDATRTRDARLRTIARRQARLLKGSR